MKSILKRMSSAMIAICVGLIPTMSSAAFNSYVDIEVAGYAGETILTNFPVLVTFTPTSIVGFSYETIQADGKDIAFTSVDGATTYKQVCIPVKQKKEANLIFRQKTLPQIYFLRFYGKL